MSPRPTVSPRLLSGRFVRHLLRPFIGVVGIAASLLATPPAQAAGCAIHWQVTPRLDATPRSLELRMSFDGGARSRTSLRLPAGWTDIAEIAPGTGVRLQAVPGDAQLRQVQHAPGERVTLQWRLPTPAGAEGSGPLLMPRWFAFSGAGVLPFPDELMAQPALSLCVDLAVPAGAPPRLASSFGLAEGQDAAWRFQGGAAQLQRALFAGGALRWRELPGSAGRQNVAMPEDTALAVDIDTLAGAVGHTLGALGKPWAEGDTGALLVLALPGERAALGVALHQALALQLPPSLPVPGPVFDELLAGQWMRLWLGERLGPLAHLGRGDAPLRGWFTDGFADFLAHRWLLRENRWSPDDYAQALNRKIARYQALPEVEADNLRVASGRAGPEALVELPAARGEWLALGWHQALRRAGHPGLEQVLHKLVVPASQARREAPISSPLATHRLLAALRQVLGEAPLREMTQHIDEGLRFGFGPQSLGPCFQPGADGGPPVYRPVEQALAQSDCQAWLNGGPAGRAEASMASAASTEPADVAGAAAAAPGTRQVCRTVKPGRSAAARGAKPRTVCKAMAATAAAQPPRPGKPAKSAKGSAAGKSSASAKPAARSSAKSTARASARPAAKPAAKPAKPRQ